MLKKLVLIVGIGLVILLAAAVLLDFDSPELGKRVLDSASEATGMELSADGFRLNLVRGMELQGVTASGPIPGGHYQLELEGLIFEHRLLPLLSRTLSVERVVIERPRLMILQGASKTPSPEQSSPSSGTTGASPEGEPAPSEASEPGGGLNLVISEIQLNHGSLTVEEGGTRKLSLEELNLALVDLAYNAHALTPIHGLAARGDLRMTKLGLEQSELEAVVAALRMEGGRFELTDLTFWTNQSAFRASMNLDFNKVPFTYKMSLTGDPVDVNAMTGSSDQGFGPATLSFEAEGFGTNSQDLTGEGKITLTEGQLPTTPSLQAVEASLGRTHLVGADYKATAAPFTVRDNRFRLSRLSLETAEAAIDLEGSLDLDGPMSFDLILRTPREGLVIKEVPDEVLDALTDEKGWVAIPYDIKGTIEAPAVRPDSQALIAQAKKGTINVAKEKAVEGLKGLFGRKNK